MKHHDISEVAALKVIFSIIQGLFVGLFALGWGALFIAVGLIIALGTMTGIWWLSIIFYDIGLWPLGAIARIIVAAMAFGLFMYLVIAIIAGIAGLVTIIKRATDRLS